MTGCASKRRQNVRTNQLFAPANKRRSKRKAGQVKTYLSASRHDTDADGAPQQPPRPLPPKEQQEEPPPPKQRTAASTAADSNADNKGAGESECGHAFIFKL